jgi:hypothetical protein
VLTLKERLLVDLAKNHQDQRHDAASEHRPPVILHLEPYLTTSSDRKLELVNLVAKPALYTWGLRGLTEVKTG